MPSPVPEQILSLARGRILRSRDFTAHGINRRYLRTMAEAGQLQQAARGVYVCADAGMSEHHSLAEVAIRSPRGIICLLSALRFHNLTSENPEKVYLLLPRGYKSPRLSSPALEVFRATGGGYAEGIEEHEISGVTVKITSPAKTIADCFKFRSAVGIPVAVEALREAWSRKTVSADDLWRMAKACRMTNLMRPYFESLI